MNKLIRELRRREVFRTTGLYVGICWIAIEVASVVLPAFEAPDWTLRALIILAVIGFPVMLVLAWIYDFSEGGVHVQDDAAAEAPVPGFGRRGDFIVIGVLSVALVFSVAMNIRSGADGDTAQHDPVSLLIADFDNRTGNPLFDGTLEQALTLGVEGASFITTYPRNNAISEARSLDLGERLDESTARLVSVRNDVSLVLAGSIAPDGERFDLTLRAVDPATGEVIADADARADGAAEVLGAMNELAADLRKALGDDSVDVQRLEAGETVTAATLEALKAYTTAQDLARAGRDEEAIDYYAQAVEEDPSMARAYSGWGLSAYKLGRTSEAGLQWERALSLLDRMTDRERFRTLGLYSAMVTQNSDSAIENYRELVDQFPADGAGRNNLALLYTMTAQYDEALAQSRALLEIYPNRTLYLANHSQYAVYAGDMTEARRAAERVIESDPDYFKAYMFLAIVALYEDDSAAARKAYDRMAETGSRGRSLADIGLADIALYERKASEAIEILDAGLAADRQDENERGVASKIVALAQARVALGDDTRALEVLAEVADASGDGVLVPAAEIYASYEQFDASFDIAQTLRRQLRPTARAYASLIDGVNAFHQGEFVLAIDKLREGIGFADLWLLRYYLARALFQAGYPAESVAEFDDVIERRSEAAWLFFDDVPTWRYTAELTELREAANAALRVRTVARR